MNGVYTIPATMRVSIFINLLNRYPHRGDLEELEGLLKVRS